MTKAESRKMARLEAENAKLREQLESSHKYDMVSISELCAYRVMVDEIAKLMAEANEFAR